MESVREKKKENKPEVEFNLEESIAALEVPDKVRDYIRKRIINSYGDSIPKQAEAFQNVSVIIYDHLNAKKDCKRDNVLPYISSAFTIPESPEILRKPETIEKRRGNEVSIEALYDMVDDAIDTERNKLRCAHLLEKYIRILSKIEKGILFSIFIYGKDTLHSEEEVIEYSNVLLRLRDLISREDQMAAEEVYQHLNEIPVRHK